MYQVGKLGFVPSERSGRDEGQERRVTSVGAVGPEVQSEESVARSGSVAMLIGNREVIGRSRG